MNRSVRMEISYKKLWILLIEKNIFDSANGDLTEIVEARMHTCEYNVLM